MTRYIRVTDKFTRTGDLVAEDKLSDYIAGISPDKELFKSIGFYNSKHMEQYKATKSVAGITDTDIQTLTFDFDDKSDLECARTDTVEVIKRLSTTYGIKNDSINVFFSGNKGFSVEVPFTEIFTPAEHRRMAEAVAGDLTTWDSKIYDANRLFRVPLSKHAETNLYKCPLTIDTVLNYTAERIRILATYPWEKPETNVSDYIPTKIPEVLKKAELKIVQVEPIETPLDIAFSTKPKGWLDYKYAMLQGLIPEGDGHNAFLCLAATLKSMGYPKEIAERMLDGTNTLREKRGLSRHDEFDIRQAVKSVFSPDWKGGQFDPNTGWLKSYRTKHGFTETKDNTFISMPGFKSIFYDFARNLDNNIIKTGIPSLDKEVLLTTSTLTGILGSPGSGKTSFSFNLLNYCSINNIPAIFFSLDMAAPQVWAKLAQKHIGRNARDIFSIYKNNPAEALRIDLLLKDNYSNVRFSFKTALSVAQMKQAIVEHEQDTGQKAKVVVIDYLECIVGEFSDITQSQAKIAQEIKDMANETGTAVFLLLQPPKHAGKPDSPLVSLHHIKGSSVTAQACSVVISLWREGYNPLTFEQDKFISLATLKDRFSGLWTRDFAWDGLWGSIKELTEEQKIELEDLRASKKAQTADAGKSWF